MIFQVDTKPEYKNQGGGDCPPPPAMSRVTLPRWGGQDSLLWAARRVRPIPPCMAAAFIISKIEYVIPKLGTTRQAMIAIMIRQTMP